MDSYRKALEALGARARALRLLRDLQQRELAGRAGVTVGTVQRLEATGRCSTESLLRVAMALGAEEAFERMFEAPQYASLDEALARPKALQRQRVRRRA